MQYLVKHMKRLTAIIILLALLAAMLGGCGAPPVQVVATTLPVYEFTAALCQGTGITVGQLVTESVSCLHDYTLQVSQMRMIESAEMIVISGAGLEDFLDDALVGAKDVIDSSNGCHVHQGGHHDHEGHEDHHHEEDPHIWLSPENAKIMVQNICHGLTGAYPEHSDIFAANLVTLNAKLDALQAYGEETLHALSCRELVTFHDGFGYFAESFDLLILEAVEEESGSEASAQELKHLITIVNEHRLPAVFTEVKGSASAADVIRAETGCNVFSLDMAMSGDSYFEAMYHNIDTVKEALE